MVTTEKIELHNLDFKDWFINQKRIPDKSSEEYDQFFDFHKELCLNGFMMGNTYINPFLYWHTNIWRTEVDIIDERGYISQKYQNPYLRDNEWDVTNEIDKAQKEKKGLVILGIRRFAKSVIESSYIAWGATFDENSQNIIAGLNAPDIKLITDKIDKGLNFIPEAWRWQRIEDNWKNQVTLGIKTKAGERIPFSSILIRNLDEGNNEEAIAGTKPRKLIIDEIGKGSFLRGLQAAIPGFTTPFGWGCSPILTGTGGDMKKFMDAKTLMFDVGAFNFLEYNNAKDEKRIHGLFIGHKYRMEAKKPSTLYDYLGNPIGSEDLKNIPILVSDEDLATKITDENLDRAKKSGDRVAYLKEKMYYPKEVDDIFLNEDTNIFDIEIAKVQKSKLLAVDRKGVPVVLQHDGEKIVHKISDKLPITNFPLKNSDDKDAPVVILEFPNQEVPEYGLYVAGVDPYRQGQAKYSSSLGAVYIYKRMHEINSEKFQDMFVAYYVARPGKQETWNEQARLLCKYYNARVLCENDEMSFINHMIAKGDSHLLEVQPEWLKEISPNTTQKRDFGISRSSSKIINFLHSCLKRYMEEVIKKETDENGSVIKEELGVKRILDPVLLEEIIQYTEDMNADRIVACFTKGNIIETNTGYKNIEDIITGDKVITHKGRFKKVLNTSKIQLNNNRELIKLKPLGFEKEIICTPEHPFLISNISKGTGVNYYKNFKIGNLEWKNAEDLSLKSYLFIPKRNNLNTSTVDSKLLYILGWYLSDGHRSRNTVRITFQLNQKHIAEYISKTIQEFDKFEKVYVNHRNHLSNTIITTYRDKKKPRIYKIKNKEAYNLEFNSIVLNALIDENIDIKKGGEKIIKENLYNCNNLLPLVLGFLEGDGHQKSTFGPDSINSKDIIEVSGVYQDLIKQIRQILFDNNIWCTTNFNRQKNINSKMQLRLDIQDREGINKIINCIEGKSRKFIPVFIRKQKKHHLFIPEGILIPIKKIERIKPETDTFVYNMEVEEDNSYTVSNIAVHNCELAIAQAMKMDPIMGAIQEERKSIYPKKTKSRLFSRNSQMFTNRKSKLFS